MSTIKSKIMTFSEKIRKILFNKRINQATLANMVNTSETTVSRWVKGTAMPRKRLLKKISEVLEIDENTLLNDNLTETGNFDALSFEEQKREFAKADFKARQRLDYDAFEMNDLHKENIEAILNYIDKRKESNTSDESILREVLEKMSLSSYNNLFLFARQIYNIYENIDNGISLHQLKSEAFELYTSFFSFTEEIKIILEVFEKCARKSTLEDLSSALKLMLPLEQRKHWIDMDFKKGIF